MLDFIFCSFLKNCRNFIFSIYLNKNFVVLREQHVISFFHVLHLISIFLFLWKSITTELFPFIRLIFCGFVKNSRNFIFFLAEDFIFCCFFKTTKLISFPCFAFQIDWYSQNDKKWSVIHGKNSVVIDFHKNTKIQIVFFSCIRFIFLWFWKNIKRLLFSMYYTSIWFFCFYGNL